MDCTDTDTAAGPSVEVKTETTFQLLPIQVQLDIFAKLTSADKKIARSVCREWLSLINYENLPSLVLSDGRNHLDLLRTSTYTQIQALKVDGLVETLPIRSSRRLGIPQANQLELGRSISEENFLKLLRYYVTSCTTLKLASGSLSNVVPWKLRNVNKFTNLTEFGFQFYLGHFVERRDETPDDNFKEFVHQLALCEFLNVVHFPGLKSLRMDIFVKRGQEPYAYFISQKFLASLERFLDEHGVKITKLRAGFGFYESHLLPIVHQFAKLPNVTDLRFHLTYDPAFFYLEARSVVKSGLGAFTKLTSVHVEVFDFAGGLDNESEFQTHSQLTSALIANNERTLRSITHACVFDPDQFPLEWLTQHFCPNLHYLEFSVHRSMDLLAPSHYKLNRVSELCIDISRGRGDVEDWRDQIFQWISQATPSLTTLKLKYSDKFLPRLVDVRLMLIGLRNLRKMDLVCMFSRYELVMPEAQEWLGTLPQVKVFTETMSNYPRLPVKLIVKIQRPLEAL